MKVLATITQTAKPQNQADFLKINLTKFAVIWVKRCQKAGFLSPRSSTIIVTKEKGKSEGMERRRREKSNGCTISFYNSYFGDRFWPKKLLDAKRSIWRYIFKNPARYTTKEKIIQLTYLLHLHCAFISINIISGLACVITKVLITSHQHIYCCFQFCFLLYYSPTRAFPE